MDGTGAGILTLGPDRYRVHWLVDRIITTATAGPLEMRMYNNFISPSAVIDTSSSGEDDTSEIIGGLRLTSPDKLVFAYSGGIPGTIATAILWGTASKS